MNWKQHILNYWVITSKERKLLKEGPKNLSQAWHLQALKFRYESRKTARDVEE